MQCGTGGKYSPVTAAEAPFAAASVCAAVTGTDKTIHASVSAHCTEAVRPDAYDAAGAYALLPFICRYPRNLFFVMLFPHCSRNIISMYSSHFAEQRHGNSEAGVMMYEAQLFLYSFGLEIPVVIAAPDGRHSELFESAPYQLRRRLGNITSAPERLSQPSVFPFRINSIAPTALSVPFSHTA